MECFKHASIAAVGTCKSCGRAICRDCARDSGYAVTCSPECEKDAQEMHAMNTKDKRIYGLGDAKKTFPTAVLMWGLFAAMFGGFGIFTTIAKGRPDWFLLIFGAAFLLMAVVSYRRIKNLGLNC